jgi:NADH-quinone oxidoreductase subunit M
VVATLVLGVAPALVFDITQASVDQLVAAYAAAIGG